MNCFRLVSFLLGWFKRSLAAGFFCFSDSSGGSRRLWDALGCSGMLWDALGCSGMLRSLIEGALDCPGLNQSASKKIMEGSYRLFHRWCGGQDDRIFQRIVHRFSLCLSLSLFLFSFSQYLIWFLTGRIRVGDGVERSDERSFDYFGIPLMNILRWIRWQRCLQDSFKLLAPDWWRIHVGCTQRQETVALQLDSTGFDGNKVLQLWLILTGSTTSTISSPPPSSSSSSYSSSWW